MFFRRNLMAKDEFKNLGFADDKAAEAEKKAGAAEEGEKGELRWQNGTGNAQRIIDDCTGFSCCIGLAGYRD